MIFVVGETARGKDTFGKLLQEQGLHPVVSCTTRPMREKETEGIEHYFIHKDEVESYKDKNEIIAYTKIGEFEYFATKSEFLDKDFYIIDPNGITWMKENYPELCKDSIMIYITCEPDLAKARALERGDNPEVYQARCEAEKEQFAQFNYLADWDYQYANNGSFIELENYVNLFVSVIKEHHQIQKEDDHEL